MSLAAFGLSEGWARHQLASNPALLGLTGSCMPFQERVQHGRLDLMFEDQATLDTVLVELQRGNIDLSHVTRLLEYLAYESNRDARRAYRAILVAESFQGQAGRLAEALALVGTIDLWTMSVSLSGDETGLNLERHKVDALATSAPSSSAVAENRARWMARPWYSIVVQLFEPIIQSDPDCSPKFNRSFIGVQRNGGTYNSLAIHDHGNDRLDLELKLERSAATDAALRKTRLQHPYRSGGVDRRHYKVSIPADVPQESLSLLIPLVAQAHERWQQRATKQC